MHFSSSFNNGLCDKLSLCMSENYLPSLLNNNFPGYIYQLPRHFEDIPVLISCFDEKFAASVGLVYLSFVFGLLFTIFSL